uniref:Cytochrome P450 n=1 Tax=Clastoptera arizonana TaxID=38151 RepID=A0A1B6EBY3_9HEMI
MEFVLEALPVHVCLSVLLLVCLYFYGSRTFNYWKVRGVPFMKPLPFLGTQLFAFTHSVSRVDFFNNVYNKYEGERYVGLFQFKVPLLLIRDPEMVNDILISNFNDFHDRGLDNNHRLNPLSASLVQLEGLTWRNLRKKSASVFSQAKLKAMFDIVEPIMVNLVELVERNSAERKSMDVRQLALQFTMQTIGAVAFGVDLDMLDEPKSEFIKNADNNFGFTLRRLMYEFLMTLHPKLTSLIKFKAFDPDKERFFIDFAKDVVAHRDISDYHRNDFLQLLINLKMEDWVAKPSNNEKSEVRKERDVLHETLVAANVFIFFVGGVDAVTSSLSHCLLELAVNPEIQDKTREEILTKTNKTEKLTYEVVQGMKYLDLVVAENLRKNPPLVTLIRKVTNSYRIPGTDIVLDKGVKINIPVHAIQNDPKYYPEPHQFNPDRFSDNHSSNLKNGTFTPFGDGPRICIGKSFALFELKVALVRLLARFKFGICEKTVYPLEYRTGTTFLIPKNGIWLKVEKIQE